MVEKEIFGERKRTKTICLEMESKRRKKSNTTNYHITSLSQLWCSRMWMVKKNMVDPYKSNKQSFIVWHVKNLWNSLWP